MNRFAIFDLKNHLFLIEKLGAPQIIFCFLTDSAPHINSPIFWDWAYLA